MNDNIDAWAAEARAALWDAINDYTVACGGSPGEHVHGNTRRQQSVADTESAVADLHAALKAARGEEFEAWAVADATTGTTLHTTAQEARARCWRDALSESTVRRVLCRIAPDDGGEG